MHNPEQTSYTHCAMEMIAQQMIIKTLNTLLIPSLSKVHNNNMQPACSRNNSHITESEKTAFVPVHSLFSWQRHSKGTAHCCLPVASISAPKSGQTEDSHKTPASFLGAMALHTPSPRFAHSPGELTDMQSALRGAPDTRDMWIASLIPITRIYCMFTPLTLKRKHLKKQTTPHNKGSNSVGLEFRALHHYN